MAQIEIVNVRKLSPAQGYVMPANTPGLSSADNITHAQLRKSPFAVGDLVAQGTLVSGQTSTFEFSVPDADADELLKCYVSTDGSTYTEDATYGGTNGKNPFGSVDISGLVTTGTVQNITATKTVNNNANLVIASGSDITVQTGGDITLADAPTVPTDAVNKAYVDSAVGYTEFIQWANQALTNPPGVGAANYTVKNTTGRTWTWSRLAAGNYRLTPSGTNPFTDYTKFIVGWSNFFSDGFGNISAYADLDFQTLNASGTLDFTVSSIPIEVTGAGGNIDGRKLLLAAGSQLDNLMSNMLIHIKLFP